MHSAYTRCDASLAAKAQWGREASPPRWLLTTTILASSLAFMDGSVVNVGLSALGVSFKASAGDLQWVINAYLLPLSALLLLGGAAGDRYGHARLLVIGTALFGVASVGCALAPTLAWLLMGRAVQGIGAALLMPNSLACWGRGSRAQRGVVPSASGRPWAPSRPRVGPVLGGWLIDTVGWRSIFLINLPIAAAAIMLAMVFIHDADREGTTRTGVGSAGGCPGRPLLLARSPGD